MDFVVFGGGSLYILKPLTPAARTWIDEHVDPEAHQWGGGIAVEHRYIDNIVAGAQADGFSVGEQ